MTIYRIQHILTGKFYRVCMYPRWASFEQAKKYYKKSHAKCAITNIVYGHPQKIGKEHFLLKPCDLEIVEDKYIKEEELK